MINRLLSSAAIGLLLVGCAEPPPPEAPPQPPPVAAAPPPAAEPAPAPEPARAPAPAAEPAPPPPAIKIVALKVIGPTGKNVEIKADGTILASKKPFGKITGSEIQNTEGQVLVSLGVDGKVLLRNSTKPIRFNANDEIEGEDAGKLSVGNDGVVTLTRPQDGKTEKLSFKFEGLTPEGKRTAALLSLALMGDANLPPPPAPITRGAAPGKGTQGKGEVPTAPKKP